MSMSLDRNRIEFGTAGSAGSSGDEFAANVKTQDLEDEWKRVGPV